MSTWRARTKEEEESEQGGGKVGGGGRGEARGVRRWSGTRRLWPFRRAESIAMFPKVVARKHNVLLYKSKPEGWEGGWIGREKSPEPVP